MLREKVKVQGKKKFLSGGGVKRSEGDEKKQKDAPLLGQNIRRGERGGGLPKKRKEKLGGGKKNVTYLLRMSSKTRGT